MSTCNLKIRDRLNGTEDVITKVSAPVEITGVSTTNASNVVVVGSITGLYVGMPFACLNIPAGSFIGSLKDSTHVELLRSKFDESTGKWSTSAANANATATTGSLVARALGFCPLTIVASDYAMGMWQNFFNTAAPSAAGSLLNNNQWLMVPTLDAAGVLTDTRVAVSDELMAEPMKRHNREVWGYHIITHTDGHQSKVKASDTIDILVDAIV